ncbi:MAG: hypothetical protein E7361_01015 [Clostridiales bacterium]|nr:hypothetical protein [Clostridiales bacterium]
MRKRNNQLKILANIAKQRLMKGEYKETEEKQTFVPKVSNYFIKNACAMKKLKAKIEYVKIGSRIDDEFERRVIELLDADDYSLNPFAQLIDIDIFNGLSDVEKQSYILTMAEKYNDVRVRYFNKEKRAI